MEVIHKHPRGHFETTEVVSLHDVLQATSASGFLSSAYNFSGLRFVCAKEYCAHATYDWRIGGASLGETCAHGNRHCDFSGR